MSGSIRLMFISSSPGCAALAPSRSSAGAMSSSRTISCDLAAEPPAKLMPAPTVSAASTTPHAPSSARLDRVILIRTSFEGTGRAYLHGAGAAHKFAVLMGDARVGVCAYPGGLVSTAERTLEIVWQQDATAWAFARAGDGTLSVEGLNVGTRSS